MPLLGSLIKKAYALKNKPVEKRRRTVAPETAQHKQLVRLLRKAQFTALGEHYKFSKILEASDIEQAFKNAVPIHDYKSMYKR
ncbi:MAG: GH3 auxin-responsive promoter family protein, partial [Bacteroidales bacterium]|nr:GH3 auxin-responsive promoter family protein [Bacteroidales bacterium]